MTEAWRPNLQTVELQIGAGGAWVDVSAFVEPDSEPLAYRWGMSDRFGVTQPSAWSFALADTDPANPGQFNPDNPASPYYGVLKEGVAARWTTTVYRPPSSNLLLRRRCVGAIASIEIAWLDKDSAHGQAVITVNDALADFGRKELRDILTEQTLLDGAVAFWMLDDPDGAQAASESSPFEQDPLLIVGDPAQIGWGGGAGTNSDGATSAMFNSDPAGVASGLSGSIAWPGTAGTDQYLLEMWISVAPDKVPPSGSFCVLADVSDTATASPTLRVVLNELGHLYLTAAPATPAAVADGHLHHVVIELYAGPTYALYVDGVYAGSVAAGAHPLRGVTIGCESPYTDPANWHTVPGVTYVGWPGTIGRLAAYVNPGGPSYPTFTKVLAHYPLAQHMTESAAARVNRLLSYLGGAPAALGDQTPGPTYPLLASSATNSGALVGPQATAGASLLAALQEAWAGEGGRIWTHIIEGTGFASGVVFGGRGALRPTDPALTLDVESDLDDVPAMARDRDGQVAVVTAQSRALSVTVTDAALAAQIGNQSASISCALVDADELLAFAQDRLLATKAVRLQVTAASVDVSTASQAPNPNASPNPLVWTLWPYLLALAPGARVRLTNLPASRLGYTTRDAYVIGGGERHTTKGSVWALTLIPADDPAEARIGDTGDVYDRIPGDAIQLNAGVSASALSMSVKFPRVGLSTSAGDYPLDLDINGERVTVASAPAGSASPQTVTLAARGAGGTVARAHGVNEAVDVWLSPGIGW